MEALRDVLRGGLRRSLGGLREEDRLAAAWTVACGKAMGGHGAVVGYEGGLVRVEVSDAMWMRQMMSLGSVLERETARIAGLPVTGIHFELKKSSEPVSQRVSESADSGTGRSASQRARRTTRGGK